MPSFPVKVLIVLIAAIIGVLWIFRDDKSSSDSPEVASPNEETPTNASKNSGKKSHPGFRIEIPPPSDSEIDRDRFSRWVVLIICLFLALFVPVGLAYMMGMALHPLVAKITLLVGIAVSGFIIKTTSSRFYVYNPEWTGYVTNNPFSHNNVPYGPGFNPAFFWEQRNKDGIWPLDVQTVAFEVKVSTKTSAVIVTVDYGWAVALRSINQFIGIDLSTVHEAFTGYVSSFLTARFANIDAEEARASVGEANADMSEQFMKTGIMRLFLSQFGIRTALIFIKGVAFPEAVQRTRDSVDEARQFSAVVAGMLSISPEELAERIKNGVITPDQYAKFLTQALIVSDNAKGVVHIFEGLQGIGAGAAVFGELASRDTGGGSNNTGGGNRNRRGGGS